MSSRNSNEEDPFLVTSELAVRSVLRSIQRNTSLLRMHLRDNPDQSIMTTILDLDDENRRVIVDSSPDAAFNARLANASEVLFDTQIEQVSVSFAASGLQNTTFEGLPAMSFPFPGAVRRVQRREFYRVEVPMGEPATCTLSVAEFRRSPLRAVVKIKDLSAGGVALLDTKNELPHDSGITFKGARLTLPEVGDVTVDLEVLRVHRVELPNKKELFELGCKFVDLSKSSAQLVQNYIGRLERRLIAKSRGF
jgi:Predicted glycosyltransferase